MISLNGEQLALLNAGVARVANDQRHKWLGDEHLTRIAHSIGAEAEVYDLGPRDNKMRYVRFDWDNYSIEVEAGPQPEYVAPPAKPDFDPTTPGSPVAVAA